MASTLASRTRGDGTATVAARGAGSALRTIPCGSALRPSTVSATVQRSVHDREPLAPEAPLSHTCIPAHCFHSLLPILTPGSHTTLREVFPQALGGSGAQAPLGLTVGNPAVCSSRCDHTRYGRVLTPYGGISHTCRSDDALHPCCTSLVCETNNLFQNKGLCSFFFPVPSSTTSNTVALLRTRSYARCAELSVLCLFWSDAVLSLLKAVGVYLTDASLRRLPRYRPSGRAETPGHAKLRRVVPHVQRLQYF